MKPPLLVYPVVLLMSALSARADWVAGRDLKANELPNGNGVELVDPNPTVPQWSYGYRGTLASIALTLYTPAQHTNSLIGNGAVQGFTLGAGNDLVVNTGASDVTFNQGFGNFNPLHPSEILYHPGPNAATNQFTVVRWTAPASGAYAVSSFWTDLDPNGTQFSGVNGASGAITVNGGTVFNQNFSNNGGTSTAFTMTFLAGDLVDFLVGSQGDYRFDSTGFDATITAIPEPATWLAAALAVGGLLRASRRRRRSANHAQVDGGISISKM